jgi:hypothetical protein
MRSMLSKRPPPDRPVGEAMAGRRKRGAYDVLREGGDRTAQELEREMLVLRWLHGGVRGERGGS